MLLTPDSGAMDGVIQFITVFILFCIVLGMTYITTRYIANFQKIKQEGSNIAVVEACKIAPNKYVQIIKLGQKYIAVAVCKDTITLLAELEEEELKLCQDSGDAMPSFMDILEKAKSRKQKK